MESHASEFYICLDILETDVEHTIFGKVIKGFDVIDKIAPNDKIATITLREEEWNLDGWLVYVYECG